MPTHWTTPAELADQVRRIWANGKILTARFSGTQLFPHRLRLKRPDTHALSGCFEQVRTWIRQLEDGSRAKRGFGYDIDWTEVNHRQLGRQRIPNGATIATEGDAARLIGKEKEVRRFDELAKASLNAHPVLASWISHKPLVMLDNAADWNKILAVLAWFRVHPQSNMYLRQIDVPGVHTKFIEVRKPLLSELLDVILTPPLDMEPTGTPTTFEQRFGLRSKPATIRFRMLDPKLVIGGLTDISAPATQFALLNPPVRLVFVTENEVNGLAFPEMPDSMVVFGLGYGLDVLACADWLKRREVHYWGDIDTHGFAMLDRLRAQLPAARSLLMDRNTLMAHRDSWVAEEIPHRGTLTRLNADEHTLFRELQSNVLGDRIRLEQERVSFGLLKVALKNL
ncbi:MAG: hypothetical protein GHHEDOFH_00837 [Pseudorhodoplanes sp.]|nr:hypothetical protein [Pseudorhodoplanes sp.]